MQKKGCSKVSNEELSTLKGDVTEIKSDVKQLSTNFNDFRVFLADTYVKKAEYEADKNKNLIIAGLIATIVSIVGSFIK